MPSKVQRRETTVSKNEIEHGKHLAAGGAEDLWGWGSPAGQHRATRRGSLIAAKSGLRPGIMALELGCGTGLFSAMFATTKAKITAIDISRELIDIAQTNVQGVDFICARFEDTAFSTKFDAVVGSSVLHHLDVPVALKKSLHF